MTQHWDDTPDRTWDEIDNDRRQWDTECVDCFAEEYDEIQIVEDTDKEVISDEVLDEIFSNRDLYLEQLATFNAEEQARDEEELRHRKALQYEKDYLAFLEKDSEYNVIKECGAVIGDDLLIQSFIKSTILSYWIDKLK